MQPSSWKGLLSSEAAQPYTINPLIERFTSPIIYIRNHYTFFIDWWENPPKVARVRVLVLQLSITVHAGYREEI